MINHYTDIIDIDNEEGHKLSPTENYVHQAQHDTQVDIEFEYARRNIVEILETSNQVLKNTAEMVEETEHPRMVEAYANLISNLVEINKSLFEIRERKMKIKGELIDTDDIDAGNTIINNNAVFVGSTEELIQTMEGKK